MTSDQTTGNQMIAAGPSASTSMGRTGNKAGTRIRMGHQDQDGIGDQMTEDQMTGDQMIAIL